MSTKSSSADPAVALSCPLPIQNYPAITLAHGGGGTLMHQLLDKLFLPAFGGLSRAPSHDAAVLEGGSGRLAFTTDSFVVHPLIFPGGDIGSLAVNGTVNDLAMAGARPEVLSAGFILEEGLPMETLWTIVQSMARAAEAAGVRIVTGDTKVVDRGKGDGIFINTAGIGRVAHNLPIGPAAIRPGDAVLVSGDVGRHGAAIMAVREGLEFECAIDSDCAPLHEPSLALVEAGLEVHALRDLTRGGLATTLVELVEGSKTRIHLRRNAIPVREDVRGACEMLGLDPLYMANEGRMAVVLPEGQAEQALAILRAHPVCAGAVRAGEVAEVDSRGQVTLESEIGATRILDMLSGEQLPRIC